MQFPIVREYKTDIDNSNLENEKRGEPFKVEAGIWTRVIVPRHSPFFVTSLKLYFPNGEPMIYDTHYRMFRLMPRLTDLTSMEVGCLIELMDENITEGTMDYDVVGEFSLFDSTLLQLIINAANDDRPVWWENLHNKPVVFRPKLHGHSVLYDIVAWQDTIELMNMIVDAVRNHGRPLIQVKIDHYYDLFIHLMDVYKTMLLTFIQNHTDTEDEHGLTALQVHLEKVDNFATAIGAQALEPRSDLHLTVQGLQTIIDKYGFNSTEFLEAETLPISQFGNTNFIPPNIDGSFEGLGGVIETGGMALESDGTITYLCNRMDGRTRGLYFSVMENANSGSNITLTYTGFKYEHAKFEASGSNVDRIAQGSGHECILVGDSFQDAYYIGMTNGSLDPAKHVYSKINLRPLVDAIMPNPGAVKVADIFGMVSIALMADWVYIFLSANVPAPAANATVGMDLRYKHIFRVPVSSIKATIDVTAVKQLVSFMDADGVQVNNSPFWRWYTPIIDGNGAVTKGLYTYSPYPCNNMIGLYRSSLTLVAQDPSNAQNYAVKFISGHYAAYTSPSVNGAADQVPEINYDFNPYTGVFTRKSMSPVFNVNFAANPIVPPEYARTNEKYLLTFFYQCQGCNVLDDGRVVSAGAYGFSGFPRGGMVCKVTNSTTRYASVSRNWARGDDLKAIGGNVVEETMISPIASSVCPKALMYAPGGEYYTAGRKDRATQLGLYWKNVSGKLAVRPEIQNLYKGNIVSRPLTNDIRRINALPGMGGATISVPSSALDFAGIEVGESAFCVSAQKRYFDRETVGTGWTAPIGLDDIVLINGLNRRLEADGTLTLVPTSELLYPSNIVAALKNQVQFPATLAASRVPGIVTVCDPTYSNLARFGWLPVTVSIQYTGQLGSADQNTLFGTILNIQPTYSTSGGRYVVTGFTVINVSHWRGESRAMNTPYVQGSTEWSDTPLSSLGPMRIQYYLAGNTLSVYHGCGVMAQTPGDAYTIDFAMVFNDRTASHGWSSVTPVEHSSRGGGSCVTPDNGIGVIWGWDLTTGGAATLQNGTVNNPLLGSVYPEIGWVIFFKTRIKAVFNGKTYYLEPGNMDLRDLFPDPRWKTYYVYCVLDNGVAKYEIGTDKRLESAYQLWVATITTNERQILTIERYNVFAINGNRISELKRGNSIPASSGLANTEGQIPWIRSDELLP